MIRMKEGAWIDWREVRWRLERRQDSTTEWRATDSSMRHVQFEDHEIAAAISRGEMRLHDGHGRPPSDPGKVSAEHGDRGPSSEDLTEARRKLGLVLKVHELGLLDPSKTPDDWLRAIDSYWTEHGSEWTKLRGSRRGELQDKPHLRSVRRWVADAGEKPRMAGLIPHHRRKGNFEDRVDEAVYGVVDEMIDEHWMRRPAIRLDDLKTHVQTKVREMNASLPPGARPYMLPGDGTLLACIATRPLDEVHAARFGRMSAFLKYGSGEAQADPEAPLDVVELDSTPADLFVLCPRTHLPLGRPTIVICIDRCTRMVLGWFVTFEKPSVLAVMQTLRNAILPKHYVEEMNERADWGIRHRSETMGIPRILRLDRGLENLTDHVAAMAARIGINRIHRLARKSPWLKGCVERTIRTMSERLLHPTRGTSFHNALEKMGYDPAKDAVCTLDDLDWALHKYFIDVYPREPRRALGGGRAIDAWTRLTEIHPVGMPERLEDLSFMFGRTERAVPSRQGIRALAMSYFSRELLNLQSDARFLAALKKQGGSLVYHLDPADIGQIVVELPHEDRHIVVPVAPKWRGYATGLSLFAHRRIREYTARQTRDANDKDDLLACKAELLSILRGSLGKGSGVADRQLAERIEGTTTTTRAGGDASHASDRADTKAHADTGPETTPKRRNGSPPQKPTSKAPSNDDEPDEFDHVAEGECGAVTIAHPAPSRERREGPDDAITSPSLRIKKGYRP